MYKYNTYRNVIFVVLFEHAQEAHVSEQFLGGSPVVQNLLPRFVWIIHLIRFNVFHYTNSSHHKFDSRWRTLHRFHNGDISRLQNKEKKVP